MAECLKSRNLTKTQRPEIVEVERTDPVDPTRDIARPQPVEQSLYAQTITETLLKQQQNLASTVTLPSIHRDDSQQQQQQTMQQQQQPSWTDPQVHIASASGKSFGNYYDMCDFVVNTIDEETVIGGQGENQVIVKSGPVNLNWKP